jgi:hypothetical protein
VTVVAKIAPNRDEGAGQDAEREQLVGAQAGLRHTNLLRPASHLRRGKGIQARRGEAGLRKSRVLGCGHPFTRARASR